MLQIYAVNFQKDIDPPLFEKLLNYVNEEKRVKIKRFVRYIDAQRALLADLLLRMTVMINYSLKLSDFNFVYNPYGKPALEGFSHIQYNLSHAGEWIVCALDKFPVGIDVEQVKQIDLAIAERFFSPDEYQDLMACPVETRFDYFFELWTLKESFIKAEGKGLSIPLNSFSFRLKQKILFQSDSFTGNYYFKQYPIALSYKLAACALNSDFPANVSLVPVDKLFDFFNSFN